MPDVHVFADHAALAKAVAQRFIALAKKSIAVHGSFHVALAGGNTPRAVYQYLAEPAIASQVEWSRVHIYFGDERCVDPDNEDSNFYMANKALLCHLGSLPAGNVHRIHGEGSQPELAAREYGTLLNTRMRQSASGFPVFDLVLLGMGDDGHTASLFPETDILEVKDHSVAAVYVESKKTWRISLTLACINHAEHVLFIVSGEGKAERLREVLYPGEEPLAFPAQRVKPVVGDVSWYVDVAAASLLPREAQA